METVLIVIGVLIVASYFLFRLMQSKPSHRALERGRDRRIIFFAVSNLGLWLIFPAAFFLLKKNFTFQMNFNLILGLVIGLLIGVRSIFFWMTESDSAKSRPEEAIGSVGIGCFGLVFHLAVGAVLAILL